MFIDRYTIGRWIDRQQVDGQIDNRQMDRQTIGRWIDRQQVDG